MRFWLASGAIFALILTGCGTAGQLYRLPYADGVAVTITADHEDHQTPPEKMFDMRASQPNQVLAAAAEGWVRFIKDTGDSSEPTNNYVWIEHPLDYCQPLEPVLGGAPQRGQGEDCRTCPDGVGKCNEWTVYAHMAEDSVRAAPPLGAGLSENDWVNAGQAIGIEGDVGFTPCPPSTAGQPLCGRHVHFAVFQIDRDTQAAQLTPTDEGDYEPYADIFGRTELVPTFCTADGLRAPDTGDTHVAGPCP